MILVFVMVALVIMSGYFSATETAFSTVNKIKLKTLAEENNRKAKLTLKLCDNYDRLISTILIGNNIVNIALSAIATVYFIDLMNGHSAAPTVSTIVITIVVLTFGEITPKSLAKDFSEKFAMFSAPIISLLMGIFLPLNALFYAWKRILSKVIKKNEEDDKMSQEELLMFVEEVEQDGTIDKNESNLLRNAIEFTERRADDILTHRMDLEAVSVDTPVDVVADKFANSQFSRLLVYRDSIDTIVGVIHQKDFFGKNGITIDDITKIMTPVVYIQHSERVNDLLRSLQKEKTHIAVVLDEYGGTLGIVTMEDILEELVGEIWDEHDEVEEEIQEIGENTYLVDGSTNLDDFLDEVDLDVETESGTLAGYVMEKFGGLPEEGQTYTDENMSITVREMDVQRIISAEITVFHRDDEDEEDSEACEDSDKEKSDD